MNADELRRKADQALEADRAAALQDLHDLKQANEDLSREAHLGRAVPDNKPENLWATPATPVEARFAARVEELEARERDRDAANRNQYEMFSAPAVRLTDTQKAVRMYGPTEPEPVKATDRISDYTAADPMLAPMLALQEAVDEVVFRDNNIKGQTPLARLAKAVHAVAKTVRLELREHHNRQDRLRAEISSEISLALEELDAEIEDYGMRVEKALERVAALEQARGQTPGKAATPEPDYRNLALLLVYAIPHVTDRHFTAIQALRHIQFTNAVRVPDDAIQEAIDTIAAL